MFGDNSLLRSWPCQYLTTILLVTSMSVTGAPPAWWTQVGADGRPVIDPTITDPNPNGPANIGQAKFMAKRALEALATVVGDNTGGRAQVVTAIEQELYKQAEGSLQGVFYPVRPAQPTAEWLESQKVPLQIGALKALAAPFYRHLGAMNTDWIKDQLADNGLTLGTSFFQDADGTYYPWNPADNANSEKNRAPATIGQLKAVFSLRFESLPPEFIDLDSDGMDDAWELANGLDPTNWYDNYLDPDGDGIINQLEYELEFDPNDITSNGISDVTWDRDGDGMPDFWEAETGKIEWDFDLGKYVFTRILDWEIVDGTGDPDGDGLDNLTEYQAGTNPGYFDTDHDNLPDGWEVSNALDPKSDLGVNGGTGDPDGDGVPNQYEFALGLDPNDSTTDGANDGTRDSDGDGMPDGYEASTGSFHWNDSLKQLTLTRRLNWEVVDGDTDFDRDGLTEIQEYQLGTDSSNFDTDWDGLSDGFEVQSAHLDPLIVNNSNDDPDLDGMSDLFEAIHGFNPDVNESSGDLDGDGLGNAQEVEFGSDPTTADIDADGLNDSQEKLQQTDPWRWDTDGDSLPDKWEVDRHFSPTVADDPDSDDDQDGLSLYQEYRNATDPRMADTDGDGATDGAEVAAKTDPADGDWGGLPPAAPSQITATVNSDGSTTYRWQDNSTNERGFHVFDLQPDNTWKMVGSVPANVTSFTKP